MNKIKHIITSVIESIKNFFMKGYNKLEKFVEKIVKNFEGNQ